MVSFTGRRRRSLVGKYHNQRWRTYRKLSLICSVNISTRERGMPRSRPRPRLHLQAGATTDFGAAFSESMELVLKVSFLSHLFQHRLRLNYISIVEFEAGFGKIGVLNFKF